MLLTLTLALLGGVPLSAQEHIWGTSSAALSNDPGFEGYWKYCFEISWDVTGYDGYGVSHIDILLGLELCPCVCFDGYFAFADTVGSGPGTTNGSGCTVYWYGYFECEGDPTVPDGEPTNKFQYFEDACEPNEVGWAEICFYSVAAPTPVGCFIDALGIKFGPYFEKGDLDGVLPTCDWAYSGMTASTWGQIKALFH
jgi:hypothetical protein